MPEQDLATDCVAARTVHQSSTLAGHGLGTVDEGGPSPSPQSPFEAMPWARCASSLCVGPTQAIGQAQHPEQSRRIQPPPEQLVRWGAQQ
mmetsp:Transcript_124443/g.215677  ORF Transcript_124443/g.215677 Transcript_124443/m.215677 type:complete len:90 (+) Transcript_124443:128-397(+)